jgi:hypothetical protein
MDAVAELEARVDVRDPLVEQLVGDDVPEEPAVVRVEDVHPEEPAGAPVGGGLVHRRLARAGEVDAHGAVRSGDEVPARGVEPLHLAGREEHQEVEGVGEDAVD